MTGRCRVVVLISGGGSNLQALIDGADEYEVCGVFSNRPEAFGLTRARAAGIATRCIKRSAYPNRQAYDGALGDLVAQRNPDLLVLAGYMLILGPTFVARFSDRILNVHPSLLPKYKGLHTHQRVLDEAETEHGASVHFVVPELDAGPVVMQSRLAIGPEDNANTLSASVQAREHKMYPEVVRLFATGRLRLIDGVAHLDGLPMDVPIKFRYDA